MEMDIAPWMRELTAEQIKEPYRSIAKLFGVENAVKFGEIFQGTQPYFPKFDEVVQEIRNTKIMDDYRLGENYRSMAIKYGVSERWIYKLVERGLKGEAPRRIKDEIDENQITLF